MQLQAETRKFLGVKGLYYMQRGLFDVLIHIYFWRVSEDIGVLVVYSLFYYASHGIAYVLFGYFTKCHNRFWGLRAGLGLYLLFLAGILLAGDAVVAWIIPLGILGGSANGIYWSADNTLKFDFTTTQNRLRFGGMHKALQYGIGAFAPFVASLIIITESDPITAYAPVFLLAFVCNALTIASTFWISRDTGKCTTPYRLRLWSELWKEPLVRQACILNFFVGMSLVQPIAIGLLLFFSTGTELTIGWYQLVTMMLSLVTMLFIAIRFGRQHYPFLLGWIGLAQFLSVGILLISQDLWAVLLFGIVQSITLVSEVPRNPVKMDVLDAVLDEQHVAESRVEYLSLLEVWGQAGKVIGALFLLLAWWKTGSIMLAFAVIGFTFADYASKMVALRAHRKLIA